MERVEARKKEIQDASERPAVGRQSVASPRGDRLWGDEPYGIKCT